MKKETSEDVISAALNTADKQNVIFTKGIFDLEDSKLPNNPEVKLGVSKIFKHNEAFHVIDIRGILPARIKTLEEARGSVISDYQAEIETNWINDLQKRFKVEVNQDALKTIKTKIEN